MTMVAMGQKTSSTNFSKGIVPTERHFDDIYEKVTKSRKFNKIDKIMSK